MRGRNRARAERDRATDGPELQCGTRRRPGAFSPSPRPPALRAPLHPCLRVQIAPGCPPPEPAPAQGRSTFIIAAALRRRMSSKGWWIGMAVAAAVVYYGTYSFLPFK